MKKELISQIKRELDYQTKENEKGDPSYRQASAYHTELIDKLNRWAIEYPNYIDLILKQHIAEEEAIFGQENYQFVLTPQEKGRIYSLVRCKHMLRITKENLEQK